MRKFNIKAVAAILCAVSLVAAPVGDAAVSGSSTVYAASKKIKGTYHQSDSRKMLKKINKFRTGKDAWFYESEGSDRKVKLTDLKKLKYSYALEKIAMKRAAEISYYFEHTRPNGESCFSLYPEGFMSMGENIAAGQESVNEVFTAWQETNESYNGQGHRRNMLNEGFTCVGIACFEVNGMKYWVQEFGSPTDSEKKTKAVDKEKTVRIEV